MENNIPRCMKKFLTCVLLAFALALNAQAKDKDKEKYKDKYKDKDKYNGPVVSVPDNGSTVLSFRHICLGFRPC